MSGSMGRVAAIICVSALSAVLLLSCGSSADQPAEPPTGVQELDTVMTPTPTVEATPVERAGDSSAGTPASGVPSASAEETEPAANDSKLVASGIGYIEEVYTDHQRPTPPSGDDPGRDSRTLDGRSRCIRPPQKTKPIVR